MKYRAALKIVRAKSLSMVRAEHSNIEFVAVGSKDAGPLRSVKNFCVTAYVQKKLTSQQMKARGFELFETVFKQALGTTGAAGISKKLDLDVVQCGSGFRPLPGLSVPRAQRGRYGGRPPLLDAQKPFQSLRCGIGITNPTKEYPNSLSVGTAGFYMRDDDGNRYLVSNNHVIGRSNAANTGEAVVQPGTLDLTDTELELLPTLAGLKNKLGIAKVEAVVEMEFPDADGTPNNRVDAAIARLTESVRTQDDLDRLTYGGSIRGIRKLAVDAGGTLQPSTRVYKAGRTTGFTEGEITGIAGGGEVEYNTGTAYFVDQIIVRGTPDCALFSDSGDSGSGVLNDRHELIGLLFAGSDEYTLVNPIHHVVKQLKAATGIQSLRIITN